MDAISIHRTSQLVQHKYRVFLVCATGIFVTVFDTSAAIVILPIIAQEFHAELTVVQWVVLGNSLTIAALLVPVGRLSDLIGRKPLHVFGSTIFALGSLLAWQSPTISLLIIARCVVGIGSAMTQGTAMAILVANFPSGERARMLGLQMTGVGIGAIAGPALGGFIAGTAGWRYVFGVTMLAMTVISIASQLILHRRAARPDAPRFDWIGALLFSSTFVAGLLTLSIGPRIGWLVPSTLAGACAFIILSNLFVIAERRHPSPMLDFRLFQNVSFSFGAIAALALFMCLSAIRFVTPFFLYGVKGYEITRIGLYMLPAALVTAVVAPFTGRLADRFGVRLFANIGFGIVIVGLLMYSTLTTTTNTSFIVGAFMVLALGMAIFGASNSASILNSVQSDQYGIASGFVNLCRNSGNVVGIALGTAIVTLTMRYAGFPPSLSAINKLANPALFDAFTRGIRISCYALIAIAIPLFIVIVCWSIRQSTQDRK